MFSPQKVKTFLFIFLAFCVLSSKSIIIYNEETLVALSFLTFVLFCFQYFGNTAKESLEERASTIRGELQNFLLLKQDSLRELLQEHKRISELKKILPALGSFTETQLKSLSTSGANSLKYNFSLQLQQKIGILASSRSAIQQRLQSFIAYNVKALVLAQIERGEASTKEDSLDAKMIKKSIQYYIKK